MCVRKGSSCGSVERWRGRQGQDTDYEVGVRTQAREGKRRKEQGACPGEGDSTGAGGCTPLGSGLWGGVSAASCVGQGQTAGWHVVLLF